MACKYGLSVDALLRTAVKYGSERTEGKPFLAYAEIVAVARQVSHDLGLDGADWLTTDRGEQFDLTAASARRRIKGGK